jgi:autotransporter adhesin
VSEDGSVAVGADSTVEAENSVAVGADSRIEAGSQGSVALGQNAVVSQDAESSAAIGQGSVADESDTVSVGSADKKRRIVNVADAYRDMDAVNLRQLRSVEADLKGDINYLSHRISNTDDRLDDVGAMAAAQAHLIPNARVKGNSQISIGIGHYRGSNAVAAGLFHYVNDNVMVNAGVSTTFDETSGGGGITFGW